MLQFFDNISYVLIDLVRKAIAGDNVTDHLSTSKEAKCGSIELYDLDIPTMKDDRENLRSDNVKVLKEYKKAFDMRKAELQL